MYPVWPSATRCWAAGVAGPEAVVDQRLVTAVPADWPLDTAAGVPVVFLTAFYGLSDLAG
ncbi:phenolphthiocerol synthesis polyketide synthase type I Pks15/1 domain protein [Mycobacterium kansasii]|uniref:Phenolphthiocerol synthesis polyketide synthase type I Pks15/1 domain protein n=1 Tax=Mycobacterium kansasii TaxID=1768 RepID=A0A1V3WJC3_MYCKA|nr:phenolphthiocerol synthesis polyketide synthase type I Pks15/1 domain protein [Mycobacterium kansasii]